MTEKEFIKYLKLSFADGTVDMIDHRNNLLSLKNGKFVVNGILQIKTKAAIEAIFLEGFKLSRTIIINGIEFERKRSKWHKKEIKF